MPSAEGGKVPGVLTRESGAAGPPPKGSSTPPWLAWDRSGIVMGGRTGTDPSTDGVEAPLSGCSGRREDDRAGQSGQTESAPGALSPPSTATVGRYRHHTNEVNAHFPWSSLSIEPWCLLTYFSPHCK